MHICINNGNWGASDYCGYQPTSWSTLFAKANSLGINLIWLYANGAGDETAIQNFCYAAWYSGWLLRQEKQVAVEYRCTNSDPCTNCSYPTSGNWYLYDMWYTIVQQYVSY
jgi:hypothetical protein